MVKSGHTGSHKWRFWPWRPRGNHVGETVVPVAFLWPVSRSVSRGIKNPQSG
jgi:hypothetical protein